MQKHPAGRHGKLDLTFTHHGLGYQYSKVPLQVMRPIQDASGCTCVYLLSPTGGVLQGDRFDIQIQAQKGSHGLFTTQAATKVYRMPDTSAEQHVAIEVHSGAVCEYVPEAAILFAQSQFHQYFDIELHPESIFFFQDIVMPGRLARGEVLEFTEYRSQLRIRDQEGLLVHDSMRLMPQTDDFTQVGLLENTVCWATWYILGVDGAAFCNETSVLFSEDVHASVSTLACGGAAVRMLAKTLDPLYQMGSQLRSILHAAFQNKHVVPIRR